MRTNSWSIRSFLATALRCFLVLLLVCPAMPLLSDEQTAATSTRDATVSQAAPAINNGAAITVATHTAQNANQRSFGLFDLSSTRLSSDHAPHSSEIYLL